jgi:hypothetical protein
MNCPNCSADADVLFIDCRLPLGSHERETTRYCAACRPEAVHELSGYAPRMLAKMNLPKHVLDAALEARRYVIDRRASYPMEERLFDLGLPVGIKNNTGNGLDPDEMLCDCGHPRKLHAKCGPRSC